MNCILFLVIQMIKLINFLFLPHWIINFNRIQKLFVSDRKRAGQGQITVQNKK